MRKLILVILSILPCIGFSQYKISSTGTAPTANVLLELETTNKAFRLPRLQSVERNLISNGGNGLIVYNNTCKCIEVYNNSSWQCTGDNDIAKRGIIADTFTAAHGVATSAFSTNSTCSGKVVSAGYNSTTCQGGFWQGRRVADVLINGQCWLSENIRTVPTSFNGYDTSDWLNTVVEDKGFWGLLDTITLNGSAGWAKIALAQNAGFLYQWSAAMNGSTSERAQGVCPIGYHIPSDCEWKFLEHGLGMSIADQNTTPYRASGNVGNVLKVVRAGGTNSTGWSGEMYGERISSGAFSVYKTGGTWWSSTSVTFIAGGVYTRSLFSNASGVGRSIVSKSNAYSVRCLKD